MINLYQDSDQDVPFNFGPLPPSPPTSTPSPTMERIVEVTEENSSSTENESVPKTEVEVLDFKTIAPENRQMKDDQDRKDNTKKDIQEETSKALPEDLNKDNNQFKTKGSKGREEENTKSKDETRRRKSDKDIIKDSIVVRREDKEKKKEYDEKKTHINGGVKKQHRERKDKHKDEGRPNLPVKEKRDRKEKKSSKKSERKSRKERSEKEAEEAMTLVEEEELERARSRSREVGERLARHEHQCHHSGAQTHTEELDEVLSNKSSACDCPAHVHDRESPLQIAEVRDAVRVSRTLKNSEPSRFNF